MENMYLHAVNPEEGFWDTSKTVSIIEQILKDGKLLTRRELVENGHYPNSANTPIGFSGLDYISLCDYSKRDYYRNNPFYKNYTAYNEYVKHSVSLGFNPQLEVIKPTILKPIFFDTRFLSREQINLCLQKMQELGLSEKERYSDFPDEVQVKGNLPLDKLLGLTIHVKTIAQNSNNPKDSLRRLKILIKELQDLLKDYKYQASIYELDTLKEMNNEEEIEKAMHQYTLF